MKQKRKDNPDSITDIRHLNLKNGNETTIVIRKRGHVDLYWNNKIIESSEDNEDTVPFTYTKVNMNF